MAKKPEAGWYYERDNCDDSYMIRDADDDLVAYVINPYAHLGDRPDLVEIAEPDTKRIAALLSAAPDLLDALLSYRDLGPLKSVLRKIDAALSRARGSDQ